MRSIIYAIASLAIFTPPVSAQSFVAECANVLRPDESKLKQNYALRVAYLDSINRDNFEASSHNANLSVLIDGVPIGGSYSDFDQKREQFKRKIGWKLANSIDTELSQTVISPAAFDSFSSCVKSVSNKPLVAFVENASSKAITIRVIKRDPNGDNSTDVVSADVIGGDIVGPSSRKVQNNGEFSLTLRRKVGEDMVVSLNLSNGDAQKGAAALSIPAYKLITVSQQTYPIHSGWAEAYCGGFGSTDTIESGTVALVPSSGYRRLDLGSVTAQEENPVQSDGCTAGKVETKVVDKNDRFINFRSVCYVRNKNCRALAKSQMEGFEIEDTYTVSP